jgi:UDP-glucuronate 4-epimerase
MKNVFITGIAGFIGYHLNNHLNEKYNVLGIDSIPVSNIASQMRAEKITNILKQDICDPFLYGVKNTPNILVHLAAETGISGSLNNPSLYFKQN